MGFSFVRAAVACSILERASGLEPSSETTAPRYLKLVTVPKTCPFTFISLSGCHWHCLSSVWSSPHWSPSYTLCKFCRVSIGCQQIFTLALIHYCIWLKSSNSMFKVLLYSFSMCRHKLYQMLLISKHVPCFVLLITGYFNVLYYTGQNCSGFKVFKPKSASL